MTSFTIVIPARLESSRLPGKVLLDLAGKPLIQHSYEQAIKSGAERVIIAADHEAIRADALDFGAEVVMTRKNHKSGAERIAEVAMKLSLPDDTVLLNVQADQPLMQAAMMHAAVEVLADNAAVDVGTLCALIRKREDLFDPHVVKLVKNRDGNVLYFSRAPIPWDRERFTPGDTLSAFELGYYFQHVGLYAYRVSFLKRYVRRRPCHMERLEDLEQLGMLYYGASIAVAMIEAPDLVDVNTAEDLWCVRALVDQA
jgi:3-deoxy-manno-octulosonate cytidylyltransferase (CMP-KDO synthetase)